MLGLVGTSNNSFTVLPYTGFMDLLYSIIYSPQYSPLALFQATRLSAALSTPLEIIYSLNISSGILGFDDTPNSNSFTVLSYIILT